MVVYMNFHMTYETIPGSNLRNEVGTTEEYKPGNTEEHKPAALA